MLLCIIWGDHNLSPCLTFRPRIIILVLGRKGTMEPSFLLLIKAGQNSACARKQTKIAEIGEDWMDLANC